MLTAGAWLRLWLLCLCLVLLGGDVSRPLKYLRNMVRMHQEGPTLRQDGLEVRQAQMKATTGSLWTPLQRRFTYDSMWWNASKSKLRSDRIHRLTAGSKQTCEGVGVSTTVNAPSEALRAVAKKMCLVIIGDERTPDKKLKQFAKQNEKVKYLSLKQQMRLPLDTVANMPRSHFARKNIGYLVAIQLGARFIFDFDDDSMPAEEAFSLLPSRDIVFKGTSAIGAFARALNPYPWFAAGHAWPRGFPLGAINNPNASFTHTLGTHVRIGAIQSLADNDPDVDAIYRLGPRTTHPLPFTFTWRRDGPLFLYPGTVAPFNAQATWWYPAAFSTMMLPATVHGRVSDIWRSYVAQAAMRCHDLVLGFSNPVVVRNRNVHDDMKDYMRERPLYEQTDSVIDLLSKLVCQQNIEETIKHAFVTLYTAGIVEEKDIWNVHVFLNDIARLHPPMRESERPALRESHATTTSGSKHPALRELPRSNLAIYLMTKDDMEMLVPWLAYHGYVFGFKNIFVFDGSVGDQKQFLERMQQKHGLNLLYSTAGLNEARHALGQWMFETKEASLEWLIKVDTDEFVISDAGGCFPPVIFSESDQLQVKRVFVRAPPSPHIIAEPNVAHERPKFKAIWKSKPFKAKAFNLGGHALPDALVSNVSIIHFHKRNDEEDVANRAFVVVLGHKYVLLSDDRKAAYAKLKKLVMLPNCVISCHKVWEVIRFMEKNLTLPDNRRRLDGTLQLGFADCVQKAMHTYQDISSEQVVQRHHPYAHILYAPRQN